jgi:acyl-CoA synthetase (AMP-forming)/AMP-acid ligase II
LILSVDTLLALVRGPAAALPPMPEMEVFVVGSPVPKALADEARRVLSPDLNVFYATTEASGVAVGSTALQQQHDGTAGFLFPGVEIEAVDDSDRPLPRGITGILRVRSEGMVTRYENESPADAGTSPLRNGWFYPGDLGSVSAEGVVVVTGRVTEVLNIGGNKFQPAAIEELALDCDGILDAAAFSVPDEHDIERAWIAVVRGSDYKEGEIAGRIRARWPLLGRLQIAVTKQIPRNHMGKVDRLKLREQARGWAATAATQSQGPRT